MVFDNVDGKLQPKLGKGLIYIQSEVDSWVNDFSDILDSVKCTSFYRQNQIHKNTSKN